MFSYCYVFRNKEIRRFIQTEKKKKRKTKEKEKKEKIEEIEKEDHRRRIDAESAGARNERGRRERFGLLVERKCRPISRNAARRK